MWNLTEGGKLRPGKKQGRKPKRKNKSRRPGRLAVALAAGASLFAGETTRTLRASLERPSARMHELHKSRQIVPRAFHTLNQCPFQKIPAEIVFRMVFEEGISHKSVEYSQPNSRGHRRVISIGPLNLNPEIVDKLIHEKVIEDRQYDLGELGDYIVVGTANLNFLYGTLAPFGFRKTFDEAPHDKKIDFVLAAVKTGQRTVERFGITPQAQRYIDRMKERK